MPNQSQTSDPQDPLIFLVEDDVLLGHLTTQVLQDIHYRVVTAASGQDALTRVESGLRFDLLLTDVVMPGQIGGFELARRVREILPRIPVVYTSGFAGFSAREMGVVKAPLLAKPAMPADLEKTLARALGTPARAPDHCHFSAR